MHNAAAVTAVRKITVSLEAEIAHAGQIQALETLGVQGVDDSRNFLVAYQEETVAHNGAVHGVAGGQGRGGHIHVDAADCGTIADFRGVLAAHHGCTVGTAAVDIIHRIPEDDPLGFVAIGVDVSHVIADNTQLLHVGFQARDRSVQ